MKINSYIEAAAHPEQMKKRFTDITRAINGGIELGSPQVGSLNVDGIWLSTTTPGIADTEFTVVHNLNRIPSGIIVVAVDKAAIIYASRRVDWTTTQMFLKANQATVVLVGFVV